MQNNTFQEIFETIKSAKKPFTVVHYGMDGDSLGACFALKEALKSISIDLDVYSVEKASEWLANQFSPEINTDEIKVVDETFQFEDYDLLVGVDLAEEFRFSGKNDFSFPKHIKKINIDHHITNPKWGDLNYVPTERIVPSTCTILYQLFKDQNILINNMTAKALMIGILSDTGNLSFQDVKSEDLRNVADLMDAGANKFELYWKTTFNQDPDTFKLKAIIYNNIVLKEKYAYSSIDNKQKAAAGLAIDKKFGPITDMYKTIAGVEFVFAVSESKEGGIFHAGFRSTNPEFDTTLISIPLGGGGHKPASGATLVGITSVEEGIALVEKTINEVLGLHKTTSL